MMIRIIILLILAVTNVPALHASNWYASPSSTGGKGSLTNPWSLWIALTNPAAAVQPGDTIYLRGGNYIGPGFRSTLTGTSDNYITVRSYPGEWAVITDAKGNTTLSQSIGTTNGLIQVTGSQNWQSAQTILIGSEMMQLDSAVGSAWRVNRGWGGTTPISHSAGDRIILYGVSFLEQDGSYVTFRDFEITSSISSNRVVGINSANYIGTGLNLTKNGVGNKAINLIIHNVGHPGIGFWNQHDGGEINGCLIWGCGIYDNDGTWVRGGGIYADNDQGQVIIAKNIFFRNLRAGCSMYGTLASVSGFRFVHNFSFAPGSTGANAVQLMSDVTPMTNNLVGTNCLLGSLGLGYQAASNLNQRVVGNIIVNDGLASKEFVSSSFSNNTVFIPHLDSDNSSVFYNATLSANRADIDVVWDYNTYYFKNLTRPHQFAYTAKYLTAQQSTASDGSGNLLFATDSGKSWQEYSGFDAHSTYATNWPTDYFNVVVEHLDYDSNRWHICVINTTTGTNATLNLASIGFTAGQQYQLRDAQNYFTVIDSGTYSGSGTINLPLTLTNVAVIPGITNFVNEHTNIKNPGLFNAFVLQRTRAGSPPTNLRVMRAN